MSVARHDVRRFFFTASRARVSPTRAAMRGASTSDSMITSWMPDAPFGVDHPLLVGVKSMRIKRMSWLVKDSRQKGREGVSRGDVFAMMLLQQPRHSMCPAWSNEGT